MSGDGDSPQAQSVGVDRSYLRNRDFMLICTARFATTIAAQIQTVALGWFVYDLTGDAIALGLIGLASFLPAVSLMLVTGWAADRFDRRLVLAFCGATMALATLAQLLHVASGVTQMWPLYLTIVLYGTGRAFHLPASMAILPNLVTDQRQFPNAIAFATAVQQFANISGPALGGLLYALDPLLAFAAALGFFSLAALSSFLIRYRSATVDRPPGGIDHLLAGFRFMGTKPIVFGAITLDLFVVVLGGAISLLPMFAKDILNVGPLGLGILRSAPAAGALLIGLVMARRTFVERRAGERLFQAVAIYGLANLGFGLSESFLLSCLYLALVGAADAVSVVIRLTLVQAETPDALRGRVAAVNGLFTAFSNEIGQFRAGTMAAFMGAVPAVVAGGLGAVAIAALWKRWFPALFERDRLVEYTEPAKPG